MASNGIRIAIVGGGLAGLAAAMKIAEAGHNVDLFSVVPVKRSHSVCAQGGINGAVNTKGEGDSTWEHFDDTVYGGDFLANQPPAKAMCEMAPSIIYLFDRMGVPFSRTNEGLLDFRRFGGTKHHRTAFAGASGRKGGLGASGLTEPALARSSRNIDASASEPNPQNAFCRNWRRPGRRSVASKLFHIQEPVQVEHGQL